MAYETMSREGERRRARMSPVARDYLSSSNGWHVVSAGHGREQGGVTAHRGVLHPDEYVARAALRPMVEAELGFTYEDVHSVYRRGRLSPAQLELRARVDARMLEVREAGGNMECLARVAGLHPKTIRRATARAALAAAGLKSPGFTRNLGVLTEEPPHTWHLIAPLARQS